MIGARRRAIGTALLIGDLVAVTAAFLAGYLLRARILQPLLGPIFGLDVHLPLLAVALPVWIVSFHLAGLYRTPTPRLSLRETGAVARGVVFAAFGLAAGIFALKLVFVSRVAVGLFMLASVPIVIAVRTMVRRFVLNGRTRRHVAIAGSLDRARQAARLVAAHREWGLDLVGFVTDGTWDRDIVDLPAPVLGDDTGLGAILKRHVIDEVVVAASPERLDRVDTILARCYEEGVVARVTLDFVPLEGKQAAVEELDGVPLLTFSTAPKDELLLLARRAFDVVVAGVTLAALSPLFAGIALGIKLASPGGPAIFRQLRAGLRGRRFWMLKFRSMVPEADALRPSLEPYNEMDGPAFKMSNDPRVTRLGAFLRRTSLDELPQLWNVLRGEMSIVGPRPVPVEEVERYEPWQRRRLSMKPGITCLWQVRGRSELTFEEWMRLDLEYIDNWSFWLDVKIFLLTIPAVLFRRGAR